MEVEDTKDVSQNPSTDAMVTEDKLNSDVQESDKSNQNTTQTETNKTENNPTAESLVIENDETENVQSVMDSGEARILAETEMTKADESPDKMDVDNDSFETSTDELTDTNNIKNNLDSSDVKMEDIGEDTNSNVNIKKEENDADLNYDNQQSETVCKVKDVKTNVCKPDDSKSELELNKCEAVKEQDNVPKDNESNNKDDLVDNALSALASAAIDHAKDTDKKVQNTEPKEAKEVWHTVGFITGTSFNVQNYFYLDECEQNFTDDQLPIVNSLERINLEPGTAYKFRVAAINSVGRSDWSEVSAFKTCVPGFPSAPSDIKIAKSADGAHISWEPPKGEISEYSVYLAIRNNAKENITPSSMAFVRVYCGVNNSCTVPHSSLNSAYVDTMTKSAIIFRIAARNEKGYGPATQVRWLQDSINRAVKRPTDNGQASVKKAKND